MIHTGDETSPWWGCRIYKFGRIDIAAIKAKKTDPVRYYTETHVDDAYYSSYGSNARTMLLAVLISLYHAKRSKP